MKNAQTTNQLFCRLEKMFEKHYWQILYFTKMNFSISRSFSKLHWACSELVDSDIT